MQEKLEKNTITFTYIFYSPDPRNDDQHASRYVNGDEIVGELPLENQVDGKAAVFPCIHKT